MFNAVHKYDITYARKLLLPKGAKIISVANQREQLVTWVEVDTQELETEDRRFLVLCTGEKTTVNRYNTIVFLGTVLFSNGDFVQHVYEIL
jgi:hypothetical protein